MNAKRIAAGIATLLVVQASTLSAQMTHTVTVGGNSFAPSTLNIQAGDTVVWDWSGPMAAGFHNVVSGTGGVADGNFSSGALTSAPNTFSITFDGAFLNANPAPGNDYSYFCTLHGVQTGIVFVDLGPVTNFYGCGINPAGSLTFISGAPLIFHNLTLGIDNPLGTQAVGSIPFLSLALAPDPSFPCGTNVPGFGMSGVGELLISLAPANLLQPILVGPPWAGVGLPSPITLNVPNDPNLVGLHIFAQGLLFDPTVAFGVMFGLTEGLEMVLGG